MTSFVQFLEELSRPEITIPPFEVEHMVKRFGQKTLQMGNLNEDGSLSVPMDSMIEGVRSLGVQRLTQAVEGFRRTEEIVDLLESMQSLVERVSEARKNRVVQLATAVQDASSEEEARKHWQELEHLMFGL